MKVRGFIYKSMNICPRDWLFSRRGLDVVGGLLTRGYLARYHNKHVLLLIAIYAHHIHTSSPKVHVVNSVGDIDPHWYIAKTLERFCKIPDKIIIIND